jgi:hypothetical protein
MKKILSNLIGKKFSVYVGGEFERMTDFLGFVALLKNYADFFEYTKQEQYEYLKKLVATRYGYVDANIEVKLGK